MKKECKIVKYAKKGMAIVLPKAYIELFDLKIGNVAELTFEKKNISTKELIIRFTDRTQKQKDKE